MNKKFSSKTPRLKLDSTSYRELHRRVLERDSWRRQVCGSMQHAGTPPQISQPFGWRRGAEPDHSLRRLPRTGAPDTVLRAGSENVVLHDEQR